MSTSMPSAADLGIVANSGTDQSALINTALSNPSYSGIVFDFAPPAAVYISNSVNAQGKVLKFIPGTYLTGPTTPAATVSNFVLDCGVRQQCFDPACALVFSPVGTTLGKISPWVFGAKTNGTDASPAIQKTIDLVIKNIGVQTLFIPAGTYTCHSPLICHNWSGTEYATFMISIEGECNFWESSGYGTILDFRSFNNTFGIGLHRTKGSSIKNIKVMGAWNYTFPGAYTFYNTPLSAFTDGVCRDSQYSPYAGIVVDPFSPAVPTDGGYPGLNAGGPVNYYRGSTTAGSTGVTLEDVHIDGFVIGFITSPNGQTQNAELIRAEKIQFTNMKICIVGCQDQEKLNVFRHVGCWGTCHTIFLAGVGGGASYGAGTPGNWYVEGLNIAGYNNQLIYNNQQGYFPSYFKNIYAELLGSLGSIGSILGTTIQDSVFNFATYDEAGSYQTHINAAAGVTFIGCLFRMYGTGKPIVISSGNGGPVFDSCSFETPPFYDLMYPADDTKFINCTDLFTSDRNLLGPVSTPYVTGSFFSGVNLYGSTKVNANGTTYTMNSRSPVYPMPINRTTGGYTVSVSLVAGFYQATVTCSSDELNRISIGDVIVGSPTGAYPILVVMGIVSAIGTSDFTIKYVPASVTNGSFYYIFIWLPLYNISFTGDTTNGSNQITNVSLLSGDLNLFIARGGLLSTTSVKVTDSWHSNLIRLRSYNAGTNTLTFDKTATASAVKNLFTNGNAAPDPLTPSIAAGPGAGSGAAVAIVKGNDKNMQVSITTGTAPSASAITATISFGIPFAGGYIPSPKFSPANSNAAALSGAGQVFMDAASSSGFTITSGSSVLAASTLYLWNVEVG